MTSRYGTELKIEDWINPRREANHGLDPQTTTWSEVLSAGGYRTGLVGKWHLGTAQRYHPTKTGYQYFMGLLSGGCPPKDPVLELNGKPTKMLGFTADILTDHALKFIERNQSGPFVLSLHFRAPHAAWLPVRPEDWAPYEKLDPTIPNPDFPNLNVARIKRMTREYYASVSSVDRNVGRLMKQLKMLKITDNTIVIFTSDHGYNLGHNGVWYKGNAQWQLTTLPKQKWKYIGRKQRPNLFDQSLRVPTVVHWPGVTKPGSKISQTVSNLDWYPTLLSMAGVEQPKLTLRGRNFAPLLRGQRINWNNDLVAEYSMHHGAQTQMRAYRTPKWKYMRDFLHEGRVELYDLINDPREATNLALKPSAAQKRVMQDLSAKLLLHMKSIKDPALQ